MQDIKALLAKVHHLKLLYIEDNAEVRQATVGLFTNIFSDITTAEDGEEALEKITASSDGYDLIITDINMPKVDGYQVIEELRKKSTHAKVYVLSAYNQVDNVERAGSHVDAYLYKPLDMKALFEVLEKDYMA